MSSIYSSLYSEIGHLKSMDLLALFKSYAHDSVELQTAVYEFIEDCDLDPTEVDELIEELRGCDIEQMQERRVVESICESFEPYGSSNTYACLWSL